MKRDRFQHVACVIAFASAVLLTGTLSIAQDAAGSHDAIKPVPRAGRWMNRHKSMNDRVEKGNVDLVFIGDSITQGWEGRGKAVWAKFYRNPGDLDTFEQVVFRVDRTNSIGNPGATNPPIGWNFEAKWIIEDNP